MGSISCPKCNQKSIKQDQIFHVKKNGKLYETDYYVCSECDTHHFEDGTKIEVRDIAEIFPWLKTPLK